MIYRLRDEPERFRFGKIIEIWKDDEGKQRLKVEGIRIEDESKYHGDSVIMDPNSDITWAFDGNYLASEIVFHHVVK